MNDMSRRSLLSLAPIASIALALPFPAPVAAQAAPAETGTMVDWSILSEETRSRVFADYWRALTPTQMRRACDHLRQNGMGEFASGLENAIPEFQGPCIYEFRILDEAGKTTCCPIAFLDHAPRKAGWYRWQHYWKHQAQGGVRYVPIDRIRIVRRLPDRV